jgi:NTP pyrophosphatase (non-canonical NTP hydrolase)
MADIKISEMMQMQKNLWERHKDEWYPMEAEYGRNFILWMMEEIGESIAVIKKKGDKAIMQEKGARSCFVEEMSDVLMYYMDTLLRYGVTSEEISNAYIEKHMKDMERDYKNEYQKKYSK